jgi:hypothetical protein
VPDGERLSFIPATGSSSRRCVSPKGAPGASGRAREEASEAAIPPPILFVDNSRRSCQHDRRDLKTDGLRGFEIKHQFKRRWLLNQIATYWKLPRQVLRNPGVAGQRGSSDGIRHPVPRGNHWRRCRHLSSCLRDGPRRHCFEARRLPLCEWPNTGLAENEEPADEKRCRLVKTCKFARLHVAADRRCRP